MLSCASEFLWRTHFCTRETGARLSCFGGRMARGNAARAEAGHAEGSVWRLLVGASEAEGAFRLTPGRGSPSREASPREEEEDVSVCVRARCKYESNFPVFFLPLCLRWRWPRGSGRPARAEVEGPDWSRSSVRMVGGSSESLFHIPGVRAGAKTVGSTASVSRCRLRERVAHWPGTSVQEAGQAGRGRGEEGRLPALERWGRGRGATAPPGHCAPADFHGRLPRSSRRRPGAGHSLGFKRHSRNVNNPGGRASGPERARIAGRGPPPFPGDGRPARLLCPSVYLPQTFFSSVLQFHLVPPARSRARASPTTRAQGAW